jgi:hypothetical protein
VATALDGLENVGVPGGDWDGFLPGINSSCLCAARWGEGQYYREGEAMAIRWSGVARGCCLIGKMVLMAVLVTWVTAAPLVWILRDGLRPGMVESAGTQVAFKFLVCWGVPALMLAVPLVGLWLIERRLTPPAASRPDGRVWPSREVKQPQRLPSAED